ncbi:MAG: putative toxin-antitoxin system toxin component, PIN family [Selenomonadaceae bacterium]|nr:putative toxin-antitoxin system toxin component, PIN family [Selenomonadaceae bacterium]
MSFFAVIDTNVLVAALLSKKSDTGVKKVLDYIHNRVIIPLWHDDIVLEYDDVLSRAKFNFSKPKVTEIIDLIKNNGIYTPPIETDEKSSDPDDIIFWQVAMAMRQNNAYLVTGNIKHYPKKDFVVTPSQMIEILESQ